MTKRVLEFEVRRNADGSYTAQCRDKAMRNLMTEAATLDEVLASLTEVCEMCLDHNLAIIEWDQGGRVGDFPDDADIPQQPYLTRVVRMDIEVEPDHRPSDADAKTAQPARPPRRSHREA